MNKDVKRSCLNSRKTMYPLHLTVATTTGGQFKLSVSALESVKGLKCALARRFRLQEDRMSLLHKDRLLTSGSLLDNNVCDGNQLVLVPNMETGSNNVTTNSRVMQALENLTESQVNDFLTGRAPLLLAMKLGEHMMFVQLQLSSSSCSSRRRNQQSQPSSSPSHFSPPPHASNEKLRCSCSPPPHSPVPGSTPPSPTAGNSGAVIDSVNHLGQGVYSGTFSGTLDPSVHDTLGRPKRDINTILQILNDLLVASPQLRETSSSLRQSFEHHAVHNQTVLDQSRTSEYSTDERLRGKVQTLQRMMQERKMRRQEKRGLKAPYQWPSNRSSYLQHRMRSSHRVNYESSLARDCDMTGKPEPHPPTEAAAFTPATAMEHESVLV